MGSGASKKKPDSAVQKKLNVISAFNDAGQRAKEKREAHINGIQQDTENNGDSTTAHPKKGALILNPENGKDSNVSTKEQNGGHIEKDSETGGKTDVNQNGGHTLENGGDKLENGDISNEGGDDISKVGLGDTSKEGDDISKKGLGDTSKEEGDDASTSESGEVNMVNDNVTKIQSVFRGFQDRKALREQTEMAIKIQRQFRRHRSSLKSADGDKSNVASVKLSETPRELPAVPDYDNKPVERITKEEQLQQQSETTFVRRRVLAERKAQRRERARAWREGGDITRKELTVTIGEKTRQEFGCFQDEITELQWLAEQQLEITTCGGKEFVGPSILLISSRVPKAHLLEQAAAKKDNVLVFLYDFDNDTFDSLLDAIRVNLQAFKPGCKAQTLCVYAMGGPGYLYMLKKKVLTTAKLKKPSEADQVRFWKEVGRMMSRIHPEDTVIHIMGCNMLGKETGLDLFDRLEQIIEPNIVRFESPLEMSAEGFQMISTYFDPIKYKMWKSTRFSKSELKLPPSMK